MNKRKALRAGVAALAIFALLAAGAPAAFATEGYDENHCLAIVTEPEQGNGYVSYYHGGGAVSADQMTWVDNGVHGKALSLDGQSDYLQLGYYQLRVPQMTFATWINFRGATDPANPASAYWQRLFTISYGSDRYFTVSPHALDTSKVKEDGQLDGVYMNFFRGDDAAGGEAFEMEAFTGARPGRSSFGLPQNEWHHVAVVADSQTAKLYIDGNLVLDEILMISVLQMNADLMLIGGGMWMDPLLNALIDDTMMFDTALSAEQIASLMRTGDASLPQTDTSETAYLPTQGPTTVAPLETTVPADKPPMPFGLPVWGFRLVVVLFALLIVMTVAVNLYEAGWRRKHPQSQLPGDHPAKPPEVSIKQAAKRKRREERERFLEEEQQQQEQNQHQDPERQGGGRK